MEAFLENVLPMIVAPGRTWRIRDFGSKQNLIKRLPDRLRAYAKRVRQEELRVVVLIDRDQQDCHELKSHLEIIARDAGLATRSSPDDTGRFVVINRLAIEELEAWYFGDCDALRAAYRRVPATLEHKARYRDPDAIAGGTWEALHRVLRRAGHFGAYLPKIEVAREVSRHVDPARNRSDSFRCFATAVAAI